MKILVLNCGSSSLKFQLINMDNNERMAKGNFERIGGMKTTLKLNVGGKKEEILRIARDYDEAIAFVLEVLLKPEYGLIKEFFPGPLTIILNKKDIVPDIVTAGGSTVGVRMPENEIAFKLIEYTGDPIAAPSANISGHPSGTELNTIMNEFKENVDYYIDGGKSKLGLASTIVQVIDGMPHILRQGVITKEQIEEVCKKYKKI